MERQVRTSAKAVILRGSEVLLMEVSEGEARKAHRHEAIHRLLSCKEKGGRSVLVSLAEATLADLPAEEREEELS